MTTRKRTFLSSALAGMLCLAFALPLAGCAEKKTAPSVPAVHDGIHDRWVNDMHGSTIDIDKTWIVYTDDSGERLVIAHGGIGQDSDGVLKVEIFEWARKGSELSEDAEKWAITVIDSVTGSIPFHRDGDTLTFDVGDNADDFKVLDATFRRATPAERE